MRLRLIIFTFTCVFYSVNIFAQKIKYDHIDYSPFIGEWIYESNDTVFKIDLKPVHISTIYNEQNVLYGGYSISVDGTLKESCFNDYPDSLSHSEIEEYNVGIYAYQDGVIDELIPDLLFTHFYDKEKRHYYYGLGIAGTIQLLSQDYILWRLMNEQDWSVKLEVPNENKGISVPSYAIMKKIKPKRTYRKLIEAYNDARDKKAKSLNIKNCGTNLDSFVGIWRYESGDTIFRVKLRKELYNRTYWILVGNYEYNLQTTDKNNKDLYNNINNDKICIYARNHNVNKKKNNILFLNIRDRIKKHNHGSGFNDGKITIIDNNTIHWDLRQNHKIRPERLVYSIPTDVIMIREK